jgi:hypothetical protein
MISHRHTDPTQLRCSPRDFAPCKTAQRYFVALNRVLFSVCIALSVLALVPVASAQTDSSPLTTWAVSIILPPKLEAGAPATLAVFGVDGRLAPDVKVDPGDGRTISTDNTGRAFFMAPSSGGVLLAKASGASVAALIDRPGAAAGQVPVVLPPVISVRDGFPICGAGLRGDSDGNHVWVNGQPALVLAASPQCLVVLPGPYTQIGPATVSVVAPGINWSAATTVVSLEFEPPNPPLLPGKRGQLAVRARGTNLKLRIAVENRTTGILHFVHGDVQELVTSGGDPDVASLEVEAVSSGDFSFRARLLPETDLAAAQRYLQAAAAIAPDDHSHDVADLARRLGRHPHDAEIVRRQVNVILVHTIPGDFRTLLAAAISSL